MQFYGGEGAGNSEGRNAAGEVDGSNEGSQRALRDLRRVNGLPSDFWERSRGDSDS